MSTKKYSDQILTEFQKKVYQACRLIPAGQTRSYKWIAQKIGNPRAYRAVGNALHKNPFAPEVPCHRVIHSDGTIGGFAGGVSRKEELLLAEKKNKIKKFIDKKKYIR